MSIINQREYIQNFSFDNCRHGNQGYKRLLIQLFGYTGHGKSSFINSCKYVVDDKDYQVHAKVADASDRPETMCRTAYPLTGTITLVDNRGCVKMNSDEAGEIYTQLGNFQPLDSEVEWHTDYMRMLTKLLEEDTGDRSADFIAPVFVYSAKKNITEEEFDELKEILIKARDITCIFPAVVITNENNENLPGIVEKFRRMGVQLIFPIENYTEQNNLKIRMKHEKIVKCVCEIIKDVEFRMEETRNPMEEIINRKKILHTFLVVREVKREREKQEEEARERERAESERLERERAESERQERERAESERQERERAEFERQERERERDRERKKPWWKFW